MKQRYIEQLNMSLSPLGFGVMRVAQNGDGSFPSETYKLLEAALECGINYFDTAYMYLGGHSEELVRDALVRNHDRNKFYIADKLPVWECKNREDMEKIFAIQLERLGTEYVDFYLLHGLNRQRWIDVYDAGVLEFLDKKRREGKIRAVGFSIHDTTDTLKMIIGAYDWQFAQLQINYYDWVVQRVEESYGYLVQCDIPCMVMEPVGGGRLSNLPPQASTLLSNADPTRSPAAWALRFVSALPNVAVTLSGMNTEAQLYENSRIFGEVSPLTGTEREVYGAVVEVIRAKNTVPCTGCRYCMEECPNGIDIPNIIHRYNDCKLFDDWERFDTQYFTFVPEGRRGDSCVACGMCVKKCPQNIQIPEALKLIHQTAVELAVGADLMQIVGKSNLVLFGAGADGQRLAAMLQSAGISIFGFADNNPELWGQTIDNVEVIAPEKLRSLDVTVMITSSKYHGAIKEQLARMGIAAVNG